MAEARSLSKKKAEVNYQNETIVSPAQTLVDGISLASAVNHAILHRN